MSDRFGKFLHVVGEGSSREEVLVHGMGIAAAYFRDTPFEQYVPAGRTAIAEVDSIDRLASGPITGAFFELDMYFREVVNRPKAGAVEVGYLPGQIHPELDVAIPSDDWGRG